MTQSVVWSSCQRLACANAQSPDVVLCIVDGVLAPITCPSEEEYTPRTIDAVLTKVWKDGNACGDGTWKYLFAYDENDLLDPTVLLTGTQITGAFCKGCLTTWIEDQIACLLLGG